MKPYLVDVPVKIEIWIRPETLQKQFAVIKEARPSILFLISDGGRNEKEWEAIRANRKMIDEGIDWDCTAYRLYKEENNGLYAMGAEKQELIWNRVDRCIFLEDDYVPSVSYFAFCAELLEKYKDDERILAICGMNHEGISEQVTSDYFFSQAGSIWGMASWKRTFEMRRCNMENSKLDSYEKSLFRTATKNNKVLWKMYNCYENSDYYHGQPRGGEYWHGFDMCTQNRLLIVPKYNMISNIGCTDDAAHAHSLQLLPHGIRRVFNMKTYEYAFPLKHPRYVMSNVVYKKRVDRIMGLPWYIALYRAVESAFLALKYTGVKGVCKRAKKVIRRLSNSEKEK